MSTENALVVEQDRVVIYDELARDIISDVAWSGTPNYAAFEEQFEIISGTHMADPKESFYQGIAVMAIIKRKADDRLFGFEYWTPVSKHGEALIESNASENDLEFEVPDGFDWGGDYYPDIYVFLPVEPFTITGYKTIKEA